MLSRVADSIYWLNRYIERAENVARFIGVNLALTLDLAAAGGEQWMPLVMTSGDEEDFRARYGEPTKERVLTFLTSDISNPNGILYCLAAARENARSVREIISSEMWEQVNRFYLWVKDEISNGNAALHPDPFFSGVKMSAHLFGGVMDATMSHGEAWHFGRLGRLLERADKTSRLVDVKYYVLLPSAEDVGSPFDTIQWSAVLKSASAFEMFRKEHHHISPVAVADFLILSREFPRSVRYAVMRAEESLHVITGTATGHFNNTAEKRLGRLRSKLDYTDIAEIMSQGLHEFLDDFQSELNDAGEGIFDTFFALRPAPESSEQVHSKS